MNKPGAEYGVRAISPARGWVALGAQAGLGAAALSASDALRRAEPGVAAAALSSFFGCTAFYGGRHLLRATRGDPGAREAWIRENLLVAVATTVAAAAATPLFLLRCTPARATGEAAAGLLGVAYCFPLFSTPLRRIGPAKPLLLALGWTLATSPWSGDRAAVVLSRLLLFCGFAPLFDLKDVAKDRAEGVRTPAVLCGAAATRLVAGMFFIGAILVATRAGDDAGALEASVLGVAGLIGTRGTDTWRFAALGDGAMILAGLAGILLFLTHRT